MLSEPDVLHVRKVYSTLYQATSNPLYYAMIQAIDVVLGESIPPGLNSDDLDSLIKEYEQLVKKR